MIISLLYVVFEAIAVLLLHTLYGKKICWNIYSIAFVVIDYILMLATNLFGVSQNLSVMIYPLLAIYCFVQFKSKIQEIIVNIVLAVIMLLGIQLIPLLVFGILGELLIGYENVAIVISNLIILIIAIVLYKKVDLHTISLTFQRNSKLIGLILLLESTLVFLLIFQYKNAYGKVPIKYTVISGIMVLIIILCIHGLLYRIKYQEKQAELEAYKTYSAAFSDLITQIRARQHEFDNHISALCNLHYICKDYDELVQEQSKYAKDVISNNRFHKLLVSGNPVIAGFLYGKLSSIQEQGIEVTYTFHISEFTSKIPVYLVVELVGNLLKNAVEAVKTQQVEKQIHLSCTENENEFCLGVRNRSEKIPLDEIGRFFEKGYSSKGSGRGLGLYNVKEICEKYGVDIVCDNTEIDDKNWFLIELHIKKQTFSY